MQATERSSWSQHATTTRLKTGLRKLRRLPVRLFRLANENACLFPSRDRDQRGSRQLLRQGCETDRRLSVRLLATETIFLCQDVKQDHLRARIGFAVVRRLCTL